MNSRSAPRSASEFVAMDRESRSLFHRNTDGGPRSRLYGKAFTLIEWPISPLPTATWNPINGFGRNGIRFRAPTQLTPVPGSDMQDLLYMLTLCVRSRGSRK
jgi:hypothetical protein